MIKEMFSPQEFYEVWTWRRLQSMDYDSLCEFTLEKLKPYEDVLKRLVEDDVLTPPVASIVMGTLAMIEEIEIAREMKNIR